jgi:hypothetical protein
VGIWVRQRRSRDFRASLRRGRGGDPRLFSPALIEVVVRDRLRFSGIERGALVEVVGKGFPGGLVVFPTVGPYGTHGSHGSHGELGLGWAPSGMDEWGRSGLANVDEDLGDGLGVRKERDKGEGFLAGRADQREDFIDPSQKSSPPGGSGEGVIRCLPVRLLSLGRRDLGGGPNPFALGHSP